MESPAVIEAVESSICIHVVSACITLKLVADKVYGKVVALSVVSDWLGSLAS